MTENEMNWLARVLHLPAGISVASFCASPNELTVHAACQTPSMACPVCHQLSARVHGKYQRTLADLPCAGRRVILLLTVRKFMCATATCSQKIFTERLPELVESYARMTSRLLVLVQAIGLVAGGQQGARLAERNGIAMPAPTLLRHLMKLSPPLAPAVRVLGVDDWSWKKGRRYGAILVDLERHKIIDLLQDRESETFAQWLREHPSVKVISRDRGTEFAAGARKGPPQAIQIADRYHLVHNLVETVEQLLARSRTEIRRASQETLPEDQPLEEVAAPVLPSVEIWRQQPSSRTERIYENHQAEREDLYRQIAALHAQGMAQTEIARRVVQQH
jgi:transposase